MFAESMLIGLVACCAGLWLGAFERGRNRVATARSLDRMSAGWWAMEETRKLAGDSVQALEQQLLAARDDCAGMATELNRLRQQHRSLTTELQTCWERAAAFRSAARQQSTEIARLETEIEQWKQRLRDLKDAFDAGRLTEKALKAELLRGLTVISAHTAEDLPVFQQLILDWSGALPEHASSDTDYREAFGLLQAKTQLLENQLRYWQDQATGAGGAAPDAAASAALPGNPNHGTIDASTNTK